MLVQNCTEPVVNTALDDDIIPRDFYTLGLELAKAWDAFGLRMQSTEEHVVWRWRLMVSSI